MFYILYYYYIHYTADQDRVAGYAPSHHLDAFSTYETSEATTTATLLIYSLQEEGLVNGLQTFPNHYSTNKYIQALIATRCSQGQLVHVSLAGVLITETFPMPCVPNHAEGVWSTSSSMNTNTILFQQSSVQPFTLSISLTHFQSHKEFLQTSDSRFPFRFNRLRTKNMFGEKIHLVHSSAPETPFKRSLLMPKRRISAVNRT